MLHPVPSDLLPAAHKALAVAVEAAVEIEIEMGVEVVAVEFEVAVQIAEGAVAAEIEAAGAVEAVVASSDSGVGCAGTVRWNRYGTLWRGQLFLQATHFMNKLTPFKAGATYKGHVGDHAVVRNAWDSIWVEQRGRTSGLQGPGCQNSNLSQKKGGGESVIMALLINLLPLRIAVPHSIDGGPAVFIHHTTTCCNMRESNVRIMGYKIRLTSTGMHIPSDLLPEAAEVDSGPGWLAR